MRIFEEFGPSAEQMTASELAAKTGIEKLLLGMDSTFWILSPRQFGRI
jgi:hypothetical protein